MHVKVLLADGNLTSQKLGKDILATAGYEVVTVSNGLAAQKKIAELHPDIVLLDVYMPGYSGIEICEKTKAAPETAQIPVLLTVGKLEPFRAEDGIRVRADSVIIKPFEATNLIATVGKFARLLNPPPVVADISKGATWPPSANKTTEPPDSKEVAGPPIASASREALTKPPASTPSEQSKVEAAALEAPVAIRQNPAAETPRKLRKPEPARPSISAPAAHPRLGPSPASARESRTVSSSASGTDPHRSSSAPQGEVCDVCGYVNEAHAYACLQCDVPLPSSVLSFKAKTSRVQ